MKDAWKKPLERKELNHFYIVDRDSEYEWRWFYESYSKKDSSLNSLWFDFT